ncbi:MAG: phosphoglucosamine mutase, partial [Firmicutes bacterium]|nr:phosphoglucosamine mutase [Candidatus Stercoripulliclostridium pullicola]
MKYFGTDGIRGNENTFTVDFLEKIAWAVVARYGRISVVIGRDTRRSGERIANTLAAAWSSCGLRVIDAGMIPTPVLAYLTRSYGAGIGVM